MDSGRVPGILQYTAEDLFQCLPPATTTPELQWKTLAWHRRLSEILLVLEKKKQEKKLTECTAGQNGQSLLFPQVNKILVI